MKYFTPELLARYRSTDDADAAAAEWEANIAAYRERLQAIRSRLPRSVRGLLARYALHDAKILALALGKTQPTCTLQVRLEGTPAQAGPVVEIKYRIVPGDRGGVTFTRHASLSGAPSSLAWILYNEFDAPVKGESFVHSLLLSTGLEIAIQFRAMRVEALDEVVVEPLELNAGKKTWPLSGRKGCYLGMCERKLARASDRAPACSGDWFVTVIQGQDYPCPITTLRNVKDTRRCLIMIRPLILSVFLAGIACFHP